jgi:hypothetical protein
MKALKMGTLVLGLLMTIPAAAQMDMAVIAEKVSQARQQNAMKTRDYSWTQRTEVKLRSTRPLRRSPRVCGGRWQRRRPVR